MGGVTIELGTTVLPLSARHTQDLRTGAAVWALVARRRRRRVRGDGPSGSGDPLLNCPSGLDGIDGAG
jgi:hypothetical protein